MTTVFQPKYDGLELVEILGDASEDYGLPPKEQRELIQELARAYRELLVTKPTEALQKPPEGLTGAILNLSCVAAQKGGRLHKVLVDDAAFDRIRSECKFMLGIVHGSEATRRLDLTSAVGKIVVATKAKGLEL